MRLILRRTVPLVRLTLAAVLASAGTGAAVAETLADAIALAYAHNPEMNRQRYLQKARDENYVQTRAQYGPQLSVQVSGNYQYVSQLGQSLNGDNNSAVATLSQPLYTFGRLRGELASARATVQSGQEQLRSTEQALVRAVISSYAAVLRDEARLAIGRQNIEVLREQLAENRARRRVGDVTLTDVGQADARLAAGESQFASLQASLSISRGEYLAVVGQNPGTLAAMPDLPGLPASLELAFHRAEANNPELAAARYAEQASSANAAAVRGQLGPTISATVQGVYSNADVGTFAGRSANKRVNAGVTLTQPLFTAGAIRSRVRQADDQNLAAQVAIDQQRRATIQDVTTAWSQLAAARQGLIAGERQVDSAQIAFAGMQREQRYGLRSTIDVLNAEQELQAAQLTLLANRFNEYVARADLLASMGDLRAQAISADVTPYDPDANFRRVRGRGMTPLEPVVMALDRIGSAAVRRPLSAELTGESGPVPDQAPVLAAPLPDSLTKAPLKPIPDSELVPENTARGRALAGEPPRTTTPRR